jgi:PPK2 family polyphosphate:nucleotide phosphotransferase
MLDPVPSPYLVPFNDDFRIAKAPTQAPDDAPDTAECKRRLAAAVERIDELQARLYANSKQSVLLMFQAMDAAGKDGTIRAVLTGVNPTACEVTSFKRPTEEELAHDFLWRCVRKLPPRGTIGVFNRSWYEEVLVVRVHPELLGAQHLPGPADLDRLWHHRYTSIRDIEHHLARNGTIILKFFLNVSRAEQGKRLLKRVDKPSVNWKFQAGDLVEREKWHDYMDAYQKALRATSCKGAPWYAIPADDKPFMRMTVAEIVVEAMTALDLQWPPPSPGFLAHVDEFRARLASET